MRKKEGTPRGQLAKEEEILGLPKYSMISFKCLFLEAVVLFKHRLFREGDAINSL